MTSDETNVVCPSEDVLLNDRLKGTAQCPVCNRIIKNPSAMRMHLAQTHGVGTENVRKSFNKAFIRLKKTVRSLYACPAFNCSRTYGTGRYFKCLSTLREHYLCMHAEKKYVCIKCKVRFGNPKRMELHMKTCQVMLYCSCGIPFKRKDALLEHSVKNQHSLPENIQHQLLGKTKAPLKDKRVPRKKDSKMLAENHGTSSTSNETTQIGSLVLLPQGGTPGQHIKTNAYLIITNPNSALGKTEIINKDHESRSDFTRNQKILPKPDNESMKKIANGSGYKGMEILGRKFNNSPVLTECVGSGQNFVPGTESTGYCNISGVPKSVTANSAGEGKAIPKVMHHSSVDKATDTADAEKLKRMNKALKQYKPIKKKTPYDPGISDWQCVAPPRKYKKRKKNWDDKQVDRASGGSDDVSVTSMQHCLKKASSLVKSLLPRIQSPRRATSPELEFNSSYVRGVQRFGETPDRPDTLSEQSSVAKEAGESPFERLASSFVVAEDPKAEVSLKESMNQHSLASLKELIISSTSFKEFRPQEHAVPVNVSNPEQQTVATEFNLENLTPELLGFLRTSVDQNKHIIMPATNEVSTQETQTPVNVAQSQVSFDNGYPFLCHFDNNDIETQTESLNSFLADAFTQTNQQYNKLLPDKQQFTSIDKTGGQFETSESWINGNNNNNQTQTDGINQLITDAFTQTRLGIDKNEASKSGTHNNIADIHTQTNLSFDNFMKNFNFGAAESAALDSHLMPDFTDMCTQTNPDPRFDMRFDELLPPLASHGAQTTSPNAPLNLSINSSHTQTVLSFDDMFGNSVGSEDLSMNGRRENNAAYTQTSIMDDIFQTDSFTQTQLSV